MKSTLILLLVVLFSAGNAVALDIRGVPLCEDSVEPRIPSGLVGEFRKLKSSFIYIASSTYMGMKYIVNIG